MLFENKSLLFDIKSTNGSKIYAMVKARKTISGFLSGNSTT